MKSCNSEIICEHDRESQSLESLKNELAHKIGEQKEGPSNGQSRAMPNSWAYKSPEHTINLQK